jgi:hypothetical protein
MTDQTIEQIFEKGYLKPDGDDWYDMAMGTFVGTAFYGASGVLLMMKLGAPKSFNLPFMILVLGSIVYLYWRDGQIKTIETGLTKNENLNLLRGVFNQLDWTTHESSDVILIGDDKYILKFIRARVFYSDNFIGYNFQYTSNVKGGWPAFFLGIRTYLKRKFENKLKEIKN